MYFINLLHIVLSGPFLIYIGFSKPQNIIIYKGLLIIGVCLLALFLYKLVSTPISQRYVWFVIHIVFASLLIYVGIQRNKTLDVVYSLLLAIGIAAFGYHLTHLVTGLINNKNKQYK